MTWNMRLKRIGVYLKDRRFSSIWIRYFLLLLFCLVLPAFLVSMWYGKEVQESVNEELVRQNQLSLEQSFGNVDSVISSCENLIYNLAYNKSVQYVATQTNISNDSSGNVDSLLDMIELSKKTNKYIDSIYVYFGRSGTIITNEGVEYSTVFWDNDFLQDRMDNISSHIELQARIKKNHYPYLLSLSYSLKTERNRIDGLIVINIDVEELGKFIGTGKYRNSEFAEGLLIFDESMETLIYCDEYKMLHERNGIEELREKLGIWQEEFSEITQLWNGNYAISGIQSKTGGMKYLYLTSAEEFAERNQEIEEMLRNVILITVIACLILALFLAKWVYKPIQKTMNILSEMSMLTEWDQKKYVDEIETIQRSIVMAKQNKDDLEELVQERMISLHNAQICALQTQINPHFLYNTLESIGNAAALLMSGENIISDMLYNLGKLMRISFSDEKYLVPLSEELEHVSLYMKLVTFRFRDRISLHIEIPEDLKEEKIVKLTLQPLIENAIQHGLGNVRSGGHIWIKGERAGTDLYLYVIDNGIGIDEETLQTLSEQLEASPIGGGMHIGMRNVNQRFKLMFGEEYGLMLRNEKNGGLCVKIHYRCL